ncbi:MAG TPA: hypothetical protein VFH51_15430 [Myxococcota bacterium]|nr:hypothetical protein [Myxococcota bacterium]
MRPRLKHWAALAVSAALGAFLYWRNLGPKQGEAWYGVVSPPAAAPSSPSASLLPRQELGAAPAADGRAPGPSVARQALQGWRAGKNNAFFRADTYAQTWARAEPELPERLMDFLMDTHALRSLPDEEDFSATRPDLLLNRMAAVDMLEALAQIDEPAAVRERAEDDLAEFINRRVPLDFPDTLKRLVVAEKHDALTALAHVNTGRALALYASLQSPALAALLEDALIGGLVDSGVPRAEAIQTVAQLKPRR